MAWRIHFTAEDLERIRVSPTLGPLAETVMALGLLRCGKRHPELPARRADHPGQDPGYGRPDRLLAYLQGRWIRWRRPVLEVLVPGQAEVHLDVRGIVLVPSVFVGEIPSLHQNPNDATAAPWLVLPPADDPLGGGRLWDDPRPRGAALASPPPAVVSGLSMASGGRGRKAFQR